MDIEDQDMITDAIKDYQYTTSPKGLAYWFQRDGKIVIKLDLPAIISQVASGSGKVIDKKHHKLHLGCHLQHGCLKT